MPLSIIDYSKIAPQQPAIGNFLGNILKGYQMQREPTRIRQAEEAAKYDNMIKQIQAEFARPKSEAELQGLNLRNQATGITNQELGQRLHAMLTGQNLQNQTREMTNQGLPERLKAQLALIQAQTEKARRGPAPKLTNYENALAAIPRVEAQFGKDSKEANDARQIAHLLAIQKQGIQISQGPEGFNVSIGGVGQPEGSITGFPKLGTGEQYIMDQKTQKPIGVLKPKAPAEIKQESGRAFFNTTQPFLNKSLAPYSGQGAFKKFAKDVDMYQSDKAAKQRIDNFFAAQFLLTSATVAENATIGGPSTNRSLIKLQKSLDSSEIPLIMQSLSSFALPAGYKEFSQDIFNQKLNEASEAAKNVPQYKQMLYNREQKSADKESALKKELEKSQPKIISKEGGFTIVEYGDKTYKFPDSMASQAINQLKKPAGKK